MRATVVFLFTVGLITTHLFSQSNDQATLDLILVEVRALNEKVEELEKRVAALESASEDTPPSLEQPLTTPQPIHRQPRKRAAINGTRIYELSSKRRTSEPAAIGLNQSLGIRLKLEWTQKKPSLYWENHPPGNSPFERTPTRFLSTRAICTDRVS